MRVTTDLWASALVRRIFAAGGFAAIVRRGASEAGAVFVIHRMRTGEVDLYGPAPQTSYAGARPDERQFALAIEAASEDAVNDKLEREVRFDPDVWVVEVETSGESVETYLPVTTP